jgi:hypothetical protein
MDMLDTITYLGWSAFLGGVVELNSMELLGCQAAWLVTCWIALKLINRYVEA